MKKIFKYLLLFVCVISLVGCSKDGVTIKEPRTIILNVDSEVVPTFSSNFGTGSYNETTKTYTHNIESIKDLYITMSHEDLKTVTVYVSTNEMSEKTITKNVSFGVELDAKVQITVEGVKSLEGLEISKPLNYSNLVVGKKNTFSMVLPSRESDYEIKFTLPNYKEFNLSLKKEKLVSGNAKISTMALTENQFLVDVIGNYYSYSIYSKTTNELVASGSNYDINPTTTHAVIDGGDSYYIYVIKNNGGSFMKELPTNENVVIDVGNNYVSYMGYIDFNTTCSYSSAYLYNKVTGEFDYGGSLYGSLEDYGLLLYSYYGDSLYLDDLASVTTTSDGFSYQAQIDCTNMVEVSFDITKIDARTNDVLGKISDTSYIDFSLLEKTSYTNGVFGGELVMIESGNVYIDLYNKDNVKLKTVTEHIDQSFRGGIFSGTVEYEGKTIPYTFPIFMEKLVYSSGSYTYPAQIINTDISLVSVKFLTEYGYVNSLGEGHYLMDEENNIIMPTLIGGVAYFEMAVGATYRFKDGSRNYSFTVTEENVNTGYILFKDDSITSIKIKLHEGYYVQVDDMAGMKFYADSEGYVTIPVGNRTYLYFTLSNGIIDMSTYLNLDGRDCYEYGAFYLLKGASISSSYPYYYTNDVNDDDGNVYSLLRKYDENDTITELFTTLVKIDTNNFREDNQKIQISDFIYDNEYKAYYLDLGQYYDHVIKFDSSYSTSAVSFSSEVYEVEFYNSASGNWEKYIYVYDDTTITLEYGNDSYTITSHDDKNLKLTIEDNGNGLELIINSQ